MPAKKYRGKWYVDVAIDIPGQGRRRIRKKSPAQTKKGAEAYERELLEAALSISTPSIEERRFEAFAVEFLSTYVASNNRYSEATSKESILRVHLIPAFGDLVLSEIGPAEVERYKAAKLQHGLKAKTVNNHLAVLRKLLNVACEWGLIEHPPKVKALKVPKPHFDFLTFEEADRLIEAARAEPEWFAIIITSLTTGMRLGELIGATWEAVDLVAGKIVVRQAVTRGRVGPPKNNRQREIPLCRTALEALKRHRHLRGPLVFCGPGGEMLTTDQPRWPLWRACRRAGLRQIGFHSLRHTFASHLVMRGVPLKVVQELLGHVAIDMTLRYSHLSPNVARDAVKVLDQVRNNSGTKKGVVLQSVELLDESGDPNGI